MNIRFITRFFQFLIRPARTKRYEILLPLTYNDGAEIEPEKFDQTAEELSDRFGGVTEDMIRVTARGSMAARATATSSSVCALTVTTQRRLNRYAS
jgi:hypothetical protein